MATVATPVNIVAGADVTVVAKPTSSTDAFNRLVKILSAQNNTAVPCTLALYIGPSATGIKIWEGPLAVSGGGVANIDFATKDGSREKEYGLAIVTAALVQEDLKAKVTSGGAISVYLNVMTQTGGGGL
jgi:hypothetical protein